MTWAWESAWDSVNDEFSRVAEMLLAYNPNLWWQCGHHENESFPFRACASFSRLGAPEDEDLVISFDFRSSGDGLTFTSDVCRGDGEILLEGPSAAAQLATDTGSIRQWIGRTIDEALGFMRENEDLLRRELC